MNRNPMRRRCFVQTAAQFSLVFCAGRFGALAADMNLESILTALSDAKLPDAEKKALAETHASQILAVVPWKTIAIAMGNGALGFIGGEIFSRAMGFPSMEGVVDKAVAELKEF